MVLDDCLSAVDTETEEMILGNLKKDAMERTTLIVSHRISSIRNAQNIIVLSNGAKIEEGSHDELTSIQGVYAEMYKKQLIEKENQND